MAGDQGEDAIQGQHANHASLIQAAGQEVRQQQWIGQVGHDCAVQLHQHLLQQV